MLEKGREKKVEDGKAARDKQLGVLPETGNTPREDEPKHNTQEAIAQSLGWSKGKVSQAELVRREAPEKWDEVALLLKEALLEKGREKYQETVGRPQKSLSVTDNDIPARGEPKHNTRQEIAANLGWSTGKVAQAELVRREAPEVWAEVKAGAILPLAG